MKAHIRPLVLLALVLISAIGITTFARAAGAQCPGADACPWTATSTFPATVEGLRDASDVAVDASDGDIYVVEREFNRIVRFEDGDTVTAAKQQIWGARNGTGQEGSGFGEFEMPEGIAVDAAGNVWIAEINGNRVQKFDEDGDILLVLGGNQGSANGQFIFPNDVAVDAAGNVYVADAGNERIQKFNSEGVFQGKTGSGAFSGWGSLAGVATDGTHVWATDADAIRRFNASDLTSSPTDDGSSLNASFSSIDVLGGAVFAADERGNVHKYSGGSWTTHELTDNNSPAGIDAVTLGSDDYVFVADQTNPHVRRITTDFTSGSVTETPLATPGPEQLFRANGVALDGSGNVWALEGDGLNGGDNYHRVFKYNPDGTLAERWGAEGANGSEGNDPGEFSWPSDIVASGSDVYVADSNNRRIQKYDGTDWTVVGGPAAGFDYPSGIAVSGGDLYVADSSYGTSKVWRLASGSWTDLGLPGQVEGDFAQDVTVDGSGNVFVSVGNSSNSRILKRTASDGSWTEVVSHGEGDGQVDYPRSLTYANGHLFVADTNNERIQKLSEAGAFVTKWGGGEYPPLCPGEVVDPEGIAASADGNEVYVADRLGFGITKFSFDGTSNVPACDTQKPGMSLDSPINGQDGVSSTPTFSGHKGNEPSDSDTVTLRVFQRASGSSALIPVGSQQSATSDSDQWQIEWQGTPLAEGEYWVRATQKDDAGNTAQTHIGSDEWGSSRFTVGGASQSTPVVTMDALNATSDRTPNLGGTASNQANDGPVEIKIYSGSDTSGSPIRTMTTPRNGTNWSLADQTWTNSGGDLPDGVYTAQASQTNSTLTPPNDKGTSQPRTFEIDTTAPVVNLGNPVDNSYTKSRRPAIDGTAGSKTGVSADGALTFQLQRQTSSGYVAVNDGPIQNGFFSIPRPATSEFSTTIPIDLPDGTYHLRAYQDDSAGNSNPQDTRTSRLFTIDNVAPAVNLVHPGDHSSTTDSHPAISGTAGNASNDRDLSFELNRWTGTEWVNQHNWEHAKPSSGTSFSTHIPISLSPGTYHLRAYQSDSLGHEAAQGPNSSRQFTVEPMFNPPVLRVSSPSHMQSFNSRRPTISGTSDTPGQVKVELQRWNGSTWVVSHNFYGNVSNGRFSVTPTSDLGDGTYSIFVYQTNLGAQTSHSPAVWFTIDTTAPAKPTIENPRNNTKIGDQTPTFSGKADTNASGQVTLQLQGYAGDKWVVLKTHTVNRSGNAWSFKPSDYKLNSGYFALFAWQYDQAGNIAISDGSQFQVDTNGGSPDNPGTNNNTCQKSLEYGPFKVEGTCLQREGLTWVSTAALTFNGLRLQPEGGNAKVILDPFNLRIAATGRVKVVLGPASFCLPDPSTIISGSCYNYKVGPFVLYEGAFDWSWQGKVQLPDLPKFGLPTGRAANLPQLPGLSGFNLPNLRIPDWGQVDLPDFSQIKGPDIGKLTLPSLNAPNFKLPDNYFGQFKADPGCLLRGNCSLPRLSIGTTGATNLLGFPFEGRVGLQFVDQGIEIDAGLKLPSLLGGVTGDAKVFVGTSGNLLAKDLKFHAGGFPLGPIGFRDLNITYSATNQLWEGSSWVDLPIPPGLAVKAGAAFENGQLRNAEAGFEQNFPIGSSGLFLYGGSVFFKTVPNRQVGGAIALGLGPQVKGVSAVRVDSDFTYQFAKPGYQSWFHLKGGVKVVNIPLASAFVKIYEEGDIDFGGRIGKDFGGGFVVEATVDGWIQKQKFNVAGTGKVHLGTWIKLDGNVNVSHVGVGGCATAKGWFGSKTFGATYKWSGTLNTMWDNCSVGAVVAKKSTARVAGAKQTVTVPAGEDAYVMGFRGKGGAPEVTLVGPKGERISTAGKSGLVGKQFLVIHVPQQNMTQLAIARPSAGAWTVETADGSVPVEQVLTAKTLPDPKVKAKVGGKGQQRVLEYDVDTAPGERVAFVEVGPGGMESPLGEVGEGKGRLKFTPIAGPAGIRTIKANVLKAGITRFTVAKAATFKAAKPAKLGPPKRVGAKRKKGKRSDSLVVRWTKVAGASGYRVTAVVSGRKKVVETRETRLVVPGLFARSAGTAKVQAVNSLGQAGKARKSVAKPPKAKPLAKKDKKKKKRKKRAKRASVMPF